MVGFSGLGKSPDMPCCASVQVESDISKAHRLPSSFLPFRHVSFCLFHFSTLLCAFSILWSGLCPFSCRYLVPIHLSVPMDMSMQDLFTNFLTALSLSLSVRGFSGWIGQAQGCAIHMLRNNPPATRRFEPCHGFCFSRLSLVNMDGFSSPSVGRN